jgi:hypothetical protein
VLSFLNRLKPCAATIGVPDQDHGEISPRSKDFAGSYKGLPPNSLLPMIRTRQMASSPDFGDQEHLRSFWRIGDEIRKHEKVNIASSHIEI